MIHCPTKAVVLLIVSLVLAGCGGGAKKRSGELPGGEGAESKQDSVTNDLLGSAVSVLEVENLGISSSTDAGISRINQAFANSPQITEEISATIAAAEPVWKKLLSEQEQELAGGKSLTHRDGKYIWDALLSQKIANISIGSADNDLDRAVNVFNFLIRNLTLTTRHPGDLPLTLQEIWTMGRATALDRAWAFASLMRQLNIDCVVLYPAGAETTENSPFLVAVLLNDQAYVFDTRLGLPIPSSKAGLPVATLAEVVSQPELLAQLAVDDETPYPLTSESLGQPLVKLIGDTSCWAPRMKPVENAFTGERRLRCYDGLQDEEGQPGYLSRVTTAGEGQWSADAIAVWNYPESQLAGSEQMTVAQHDDLRVLKYPWKAGWQGSNEEQTQSQDFSASARSQFAARVKQLTGDYGDAIRLYVQIGKTNRELEQLKKGIFVPQLFPQEKEKKRFGQGAESEKEEKDVFNKTIEELNKLKGEERRYWLQNLLTYHSANIKQHNMAAPDAEYWVGVSQFETGKISAATNTFQRYLEKNPEGSWAASCRYYLAVIQAAEGNYAAAADILAETSPADPAYAGHHVLYRIWKEQSDKKTPTE